MANIAIFIDKIRAAILGEEVRESIANGIESINAEVISTTNKQDDLKATFDGLIINAGNSNAEIVAARKGEVSLPVKIENIDAQLEEKATKVDVDSLLLTKANQSALLATDIIAKDAQTKANTPLSQIADLTIPASKLKILNESDRLGLANLKQEVIQAMAGTTSINAIPADKSVTPEKLSFTKEGKNLLDKTTAINGKYVRADNGTITTQASFSYIKKALSPNTQYTVSSITNDKQIAFFTSADVFISGVTAVGTFTTPSNIGYATISCETVDLPNLQLELGTIKTAYEAYTNYIDPTLIKKDELAISGVKSKNLFNIAKATNGKYVRYNDGVLTTQATFSYSENIPLLHNTQYIASSLINDRQIAFFNSSGVFISGILAVNGFTTPATTSYCVLSAETSDLGTLQLELGTVKTSYTSYGVKVDPNTLDFPNIKNQLTYESNMRILLPKFIFMVVGEEYSIYWRNIIKLSNKLKSGDYYIRAQRVDGSVYSKIGEDLGYKWYYTPAIAEQFNLEIRLYNVLTGDIIDKKVVTVLVSIKDQITAKTGSIITLADSFGDEAYVTKNIHDLAMESSNLTLNMVGLNDTGVSGAKDNAWSGKNYDWLYNNATGYLRSDRPLLDAVWDSGWGMGEVNGWTSGQTYADLTAEQKTHGYTKNEFHNPSTNKFDFKYFIDTYFPSIVPSTTVGSSHIDSVISLYGLNDCIWGSPSDIIARFPLYKTYIDYIFNSIHSWDANIKIGVGLVTPQMEDDAFMNSWSDKFLHGTSAKYVQELWNEFMLDNYDTDAWRAKNLYIIPTHAHFDTRLGLGTKVINPVKFNTSYTEVVASDVHPVLIGAKYIADTARNFIINKVIH